MRVAHLLGLSLILLTSAASAKAPPTVDEALAGRTPGKSRTCIDRTFVDDTTIFDGAILYRMRGGPDYLNRPDICPALTPGRGLVTVSPTSSLCRGDTVQVVDFGSHTPYGSCFLSDFVPYSRAKKPKGQ